MLIFKNWYMHPLYMISLIIQMKMTKRSMKLIRWDISKNQRYSMEWMWKQKAATYLIYPYWEYGYVCVCIFFVVVVEILWFILYCFGNLSCALNRILWEIYGCDGLKFKICALLMMSVFISKGSNAVVLSFVRMVSAVENVDRGKGIISVIVFFLLWLNCVWLCRNIQTNSCHTCFS